MVSCWGESPEDRPNFNEILSKMKMINGGREINLVDSMISRLEEHSKKLETIVVQRYFYFSFSLKELCNAGKMF